MSTDDDDRLERALIAMQGLSERWEERLRAKGDAMFRPGGVQKKCQRTGCEEDAGHYSPVLLMGGLPEDWCVRDEQGWSFLCGPHYDLLIDRDYRDALEEDDSEEEG